MSHIGEPLPAAVHDVAYASWGRRGVAYMVDVVILAIPLVLLIVLAVATPAGEAATGWFALAYLVAAYGLPLAYFTYFHGGERGQSPGKILMGIRVRAVETGARLSYGRAFGRYAIMLLFGFFVLPVFVDFLWPLWDGKNQALHDKVARSVVVRAS